jgi:hypothetical protein
MQRKPSAMASHHLPHTRVAWWASFFATLALIAILGLAKSAQALTVPPGSDAGIPTVLAPPPDEEGEGEAEAETSEGEEGEAEECEEDDEECEEDEIDGFEAPEECLLDSARATIFATPNRDKVSLQLHYTTTSPTSVAVDYGLHGSKGSLYLGGDRKLFASRGVLHLTKNLNEAQMAKVMAAKGFTVRLRVPAAPRYCSSFFDRQLNIRQATPSGLSWQQDE